MSNHSRSNPPAAAVSANSSKPDAADDPKGLGPGLEVRELHDRRPLARSNSGRDDIDLDHDRLERCGFPEAIFGEGKTVDQLSAIVEEQILQGTGVLMTRIEEPTYTELSDRLMRRPALSVQRNSVAKTVTVLPQVEQDSESNPATIGYVPIVAAGTTDVPVVEEAYETLRWMKIGTRRIVDVGVAGPHRFVRRLPDVQGADAVIVVAGMEGALPSVVAGYVDCPVVAVPTSVGYGANLGGISALLSMLNSCAANVAVVNIDAGFKAASVAGLIASRVHRRKA